VIGRRRIPLIRDDSQLRAPTSHAEELEETIRLRLYGERHQVERLVPAQRGVGGEDGAGAVEPVRAVAS
jgi:hypothetical protein